MGSICDLWLWVCVVVCCGFVLWYCVGGGCIVFCGAVGLFVFCFFPAVVVVVVVGVADGRLVVVGAVMFFKVVGYIILL